MPHPCLSSFWGLAHLYIPCKGGNDEVGGHERKIGTRAALVSTFAKPRLLPNSCRPLKADSVVPLSLPAPPCRAIRFRRYAARAEFFSPSRRFVTASRKLGDWTGRFFRPAGAGRLPLFPTACAVGCILTPLRGSGLMLSVTSPQHLQRTNCHLHRPIVPAAWRHNLARSVFIVRTSHLTPSLAILLPHRPPRCTRPEGQVRPFL